MLQGRRILLGIAGGIAAYKGPALVRALRAAGAEVRVVITPSAEKFVTRLSLQTVSGYPVYMDLFEPDFEKEIGHIALARWPDAILVAPGSANFIARLAHGMCNDLLTTLLCATDAPVVVAPAMNTQMFLHPAVTRNLETLASSHGYTIVPPDSGELACSETGPGRMPDPPVLIDALVSSTRSGPLQGKHVLVTAGPTRERLDPVRFLTNHSSGKMGFAFAEAAARLGAQVTLIAGPVGIETPRQVQRVDVESAAEMCEAVLARVADCQLVIKAAAVADWRPTEPSTQKRKKGEGPLAIAFERTTDILATLGALPDETRPTLVGFAAETHNVEQYARRKCQDKNLDFIVANQVGGASCTFGSNMAKVTVIARDGTLVHIGPDTKASVALLVFKHVVEGLK